MNGANVIPNSAHRALPGAKSAYPVALDTVRVRFDAYELDGPNATLLRDGKAVTLAPRPFEVLCALARQPGLLITKNALLDEVWGHRFVTDSSLRTAIAQLRIALQDDARNPRFIEAVPRRGYRFIAAGRVVAGESAATQYIEHRQPHAPPTPLETAGITAERALCEIREMLFLLVEHAQGGQGAAVRLVDYLTQWTSKTTSEFR
jgi:DNA-binding winged helix-turn-helix (wHTH) protein